MKTLIVYATKYGGTKSCAEKLSEEFNNNVDLVNIKNYSSVDLSKYDSIIIGTSIYMGKIKKNVLNFINKNIAILMQKKVGIFTSCLSENNEDIETIKKEIPEELFNHLVKISRLGYSLNMEKMNFFYKSIIKKITGKTESHSEFFEDKIKEFALEFK